jgi:hypothetical protein
VWITAFICTLFLGIELGLGISIGLAMLIVIFESAFPHTAMLGRIDKSTVYRWGLPPPPFHLYLHGKHTALDGSPQMLQLNNPGSPCHQVSRSSPKHTCLTVPHAHKHGGGGWGWGWGWGVGRLFVVRLSQPALDVCCCRSSHPRPLLPPLCHSAGTWSSIQQQS